MMSTLNDLTVAIAFAEDQESGVTTSSTSSSALDTIGQDEADPYDSLAQELKALQSNAKNIALIGSRNVPLPHQNLVEGLSFHLVNEGNTVITSGGASGINAAAIRGAMKADPKSLRVILPQTIGHQPSEVQDELIGIPNIEEHPEWDKMTLADASRLCNRAIVDACDQLIVFLFHDSTTLQKAIDYAEETHKIVTRFYLD
jgi:hypothetical protein